MKKGTSDCVSGVSIGLQFDDNQEGMQSNPSGTDHYALQAGLEAGDTIRALICEMKSGITEANRWDEQSRALVPHLCVSDCRSLADYVNSNEPAKTQDKRFGIELASIRQSVWDEQNQPTWNGQGGYKAEWSATATMPADCLTNSMKPTYLLKILRESWIGLQQTK